MICIILYYRNISMHIIPHLARLNSENPTSLMVILKFILTRKSPEFISIQIIAVGV